MRAPLRRAAIVLAAAALALSFLALASAQPRRPRPSERAAEAKVAPETLEKLASGDPAKVRAALDEVRMMGKPAVVAAPAIAKLLERGATLPVAQAAIETLADLEAEAGSAAIAPYVRHRNLLLRAAAVKALAATGVKRRGRASASRSPTPTRRSAKTP